MTNFQQIDNTQTDQSHEVFSGFDSAPPEAGPALLRLAEYVEMGEVQESYDGIPKKTLSKKVRLTFEIVFAKNQSHQILKDDGTLVRNKTVTLYLNKGWSDRAKYRKVFNKMNHEGAVAISKTTLPSMHVFLGKGFKTELFVNKSEKNGKTYINLNPPGGEIVLGAAQSEELDESGMPTGDYRKLAVPEMNSPQVCFLWGSSVSDDMLRLMWDSIYREGTYTKGEVEHSLNFTQNDISNPETNLAWIGSREQLLLMPDSVDSIIAEEEAPSDPTPATVSQAVDPLEGL